MAPSERALTQQILEAWRQQDPSMVAEMQRDHSLTSNVQGAARAALQKIQDLQAQGLGEADATQTALREALTLPS